MAASTRQFNQELYQEHLEEASCLYEQRGALFHDPEISWLDLGDFEERLEAHIDALVIGADAALEICAQQALAGDAGDLYAAVRVFCRRKRLDLIQQVLEALDIEDEERLLAVRNALKLEWPEDWNPELSRMLEQVPDKSIAVMPAVAGFKRIPAEGALTYVLPICPECVLFPQLKSMGRLQTRSAEAAFHRHLSHKDSGIQGSAALSLLRMGVSLLHAIPDDLAGLQFWQLMSIALAGGPEYIQRMIDQLEKPMAAADEALVLGVLGDPRCVDGLIHYLSKGEEPETTALALNLITGADLTEEVFVPEKIEEDELFDEELEKLHRGVPLYAPGEEPGSTIEQLSVDPQKWEIWWRQNKSDFKKGIRYRNGAPYGPQRLLDNLRSEKSPVLLRQIAYEELVVRYAVDVAFETDMTVKSQLEALKQMEAAVAAKAGDFDDGGWYFAGRLID